MKKELIKPPIATGISMWKSLFISNAINKPAPVITGIARKNENRAAFFGLIPKNNAQLIVIPLLDIPGIIAMA
tara:strand:+ start:826 stop:1044 length:219 start_codon:yes stop_codon:yes gene_type:complete